MPVGSTPSCRIWLLRSIGRTALHEVAATGNTEMAAFLLMSKAGVGTLDGNG